MGKVTRQFTVTTSPGLMRRLERFLALLHFNSSFGHSGLFAMALDGDGCEKMTIAPLDSRLSHEVDLIGGSGASIEVARSDSYVGKYLRDEESRWHTGPAANLYNSSGEVVKTVPSCDWNIVKNHTKETTLQQATRQGVPETQQIKKAEIATLANYCCECGSKFKFGESFCGKCGKARHLRAW